MSIGYFKKSLSVFWTEEALNIKFQQPAGLPVHAMHIRIVQPVDCFVHKANI